MRTWLKTPWLLGATRGRWLLFLAAAIAIPLLWVFLSPVVATLVGLVAVPPWARGPAPAVIERQAEAARTRLVQITSAADARDAALKAEVETIRERVARMTPRERELELERTRRKQGQ